MYLVKADLKTVMYEEIINTITRDEDDLIEDVIESAIGEAEGYLERFNTDALFEATGNSRHPTLLMYVKDIFVWHFLAVANPDTDLDFREKRYKSAIHWLTKIQAGKSTPKGFPLSTVETTNEAFTVSSDTKRETSF